MGFAVRDQQGAGAQKGQADLSWLGRGDFGGNGPGLNIGGKLQGNGYQQGQGQQETKGPAK
ncbi:hypothetical protein A15D_03066 [Alcanivorax sp. MD8A]|nr:hypothetical protein A15D_03066 [Alcanivorax sp. MD8A]|tara:strand:+ start:3986 stop:4168 length:183 start_codon:yes stop_codon:yes gene_type:complete